MGPLSYFEIIGSNTNLFIALLIGMAFGFVLESAGFSSSRKLAGVFYGYDMVVLKVFFTAAVTAMIGLLVFSFLGWIDLSVIYLNPLFGPSLIVGSVIMGVGFIVGGFCPGTSVCAAAIGKIDAMIFILGMFIGIFIFIEAYPMFESLYKANYQGAPKLSELIGLSDGIVALAIVIVALSAFFFAEWIESKFGYRKNIK